MKKIVFNVVLFIILVLITCNVLATTSINAAASSSAQDIKVGQEVTIKLSFDQYKEIGKGINAYKATLEYNKEIFEKVGLDDFELLNNWEQLQYNQETGEFVALKRVGSKAPEDVIQITLRVKENANSQETEVRFKDIVTSEGKEDLFVQETNVKINIIKEQIKNPIKPEKPDDNNTNKSADEEKDDNNDEDGNIVGAIIPKPDNNGNGGNQDNTTSNNKLPNLGIKLGEKFFISLIAIIILLIVLYISKNEGKRAKKTNRGKPKIIVTSLMIGIISVQMVGIIYAAVSDFVTKGELNDDGEVNYSDVKLLELHLIHKQELPENKLQNADINNDGKLTITDLTLLVQKVEKALDYQVQFSDIELDNYYPNKEEEITVKFDAYVSYEANIRKVVVNGQECEVNKSDETNNQYTLKTSTGNVSGIKEYHFTEVLLDNEKRIKVDYKLRIDVLKEKPRIENYLTEENIDEQKIKVSFNLVDKDNSITSAKIKVFDEEEKVTQEVGIVKGQNQIEVSVPDGKTYKANIILTYDLDTNELKQEEDHFRMEQIVKELKMDIDYKIKITNIITKKDDKTTTTFDKEQPIQLVFSMTNSTQYEPSTIKVNGKEYETVKKDKQYMATIDGIAQVGEKEIVIEEIVLNNGKKFALEKDNKVKIKVIKQKPTITDFKSEENITENNIKVSFNLEDKDKAIIKLSIILLNAEGKEIEKQELSQEEIEKAGQIEKNLSTKISSKYKIKIIATYNQTEVDTEDIEDSLLFEQEIKAEPQITIKQVTCDKDYVEKGENVTITYDIETNKTENISKIRVSNTDCNVTKLANGKYKVILAVGENSGVQELITSKIIYSDNTIANVSETVKVDILKDKPSVKNFKQEDNTENSQVILNFELTDEDSSLINGKAILSKKDDSNVKEEKKIQKGQNSITFDVENAEIYTLEIKATYDRDTNTLEGKSEEDNKVTEEVLISKEIQLLSDYELEINNIKTYKASKESKYFEKDKTIIVKFESTNISKFIPEKAVINGKEYELIKKENIYQTEIDGYTESGIKDIIIEKIILNNTKELQLTENNQVKIEILKTKPKVTKFSYVENDDNTVTVTFQIDDEEETVTGGKIVITGEGETKIKTQNITRGENKVTFEKTESETYLVKIFADYNLDTNTIETGKNEAQNEKMFEQEINTGDRLIEMKDINNVELYRQNGQKIEKVANVAIANLANLDNYIVKVDMKNLRSFYAPIKEYYVEDNKLKLVLKYDKIVQYDGEQKKNQLEIEYGIIENDTAINVDLLTLIEAIKKNPAGNYKLTTDVDMKTINVGTHVIPEEFTGTIDFQGHTIKNLKVPLFSSLNGATIKNLVIESANVRSNGILTQTMTNGATVENVHITNSTLRGINTVGTGAFTGSMQSKSKLENCSATNVDIGTNKVTGGLTGSTNDSSIKNCYITGKVSSGSDATGGVIGIAGNNSKLDNVYANITTDYSWTNGSVGGLVGHPVSITLNNCVSLAVAKTDGHGAKVYGSYSGSAISNASKKVFELSTSNMKPNAGSRGIQAVTAETLKTKEFYIQELGLDENIWNLENVEKGELPTLRNSDPTNKVEERPSNSEIYLPDYSRIKNLSNYKQEKEIAYYNMYRLMPFYDAKYYVEDGNKLETNHILNTKIISHIFTYDKNGKAIFALSQEQKDRIKTIKILFTDGEVVSYSVTYKDNTDQIVNYTINDLKLDYTFDKYLINTQSNSYQYIVKQVKNFNFTEDLATLVEGKEVRTTVENYDKVTANAEDFALKLLANNNEYTISTQNAIADKKIKKELETDKTLEKLVYVYNFYNRYYDIEIGGIKMSDIMYFDASVFTNELNSIIMTNTFINANATDRSTNRIVNYYNNHIKQNIGLQYIDFLEFFIKNLTNEKYKKDPASWIIDNFDGVIYEEAAPRYPNIRYRVWDHFRHGDQNSLALFLSYHGKELYLLGIPTTLLTGNIELNDYKRAYPNIEDRINLLKNFAKYSVAFYDTLAGVIEGTQGFTNMMNFTQFSYDSTYVRNWSQVENIDPAFKAYNEPMNLWITTPASSAAFANGSNMYWVNHHALTDFVVYSHEAVHNQDGRLFLQGTGRRRGAGGEHFTDNFLTQAGGYSAYGVVPNYSYTRPITSTVTNNISKERINTRAKIESYYKGMYDTFAYLDYIEAQAFLKLTPAEQCRIAQVVENQMFEWKTEEDFKKMNLKTIEDIWDNHLLIIRGNKAYTTGSMWYIVENKAVGASNKTFFVLNAYQFLADFGYDAYVAYAGNKYGSKTDEEILRIISGDETITWKKYQLDRYEKVKEKLNTFTYINTNEAIEKTLEAMKLDVENNVPIDINSYASTYREAMYGYLKRITNDFETSIYDQAPNVVYINSAKELVEKVKEHPEVNIILNNDIDFTGYSIEEEKQTIMDSFVGMLDGNGHKITGFTKPLFNNMVFVHVKNLTLENNNVEVNYNKAGILAKTMDFSHLENITLKNVTMKGTATIGGISGTINRSTVSDIIYQNVNVSSINNANEIGGLFGVAVYTGIENVHGINVEVRGNSNIAGIVGNANYIYKMEESSFNGTITGTGNNIGGLFGYLQNSRIENSYSLGKITGRSYTGGLVGNVSASAIDKCFSNTFVKGNILAGTGGLVGNVVNASGTRKITNSISLGRVSNGYKFEANSTKEIIEGYFDNNYELKEAMGHSTLEKEGINFNNKVTEISLTNVNKEFYKDTLHWDEEIWNFKNVDTEGLPKLRNSDSNDETTIIQKTEISSAKDFLKINDNPEAIYTITKDIDFTSFALPEGTNTVITEVFTGRIEGNNHTISNLRNASLFAHFRGMVQDLNIRDFENVGNTDFVTAFTKESYTATFKNMTFENITLSGRNNVAVVTGMDGRENANSIFDRITIKNANVTATGVYASAFIGRKYGGKVTNCYVQGTLEFTATECGGIIGASHQGVQIENVISNVNINRPRSTDSRNNNGGFIGNVFNTPTIKNCISMGNMTGFNETNVHKFAGCTEEMIKEHFENCYELKTATGTSSINTNTRSKLKEATTANLKDRNFYKNTLKFDETIWDLSKVGTNCYPELK